VGSFGARRWDGKRDLPQRTRREEEKRGEEGRWGRDTVFFVFSSVFSVPSS
jgi:hypothetical protein